MEHRTLLLSVASVFEKEAEKIEPTQFTIEDWERITNTLIKLKFPHLSRDKPSYRLSTDYVPGTLVEFNADYKELLLKPVSSLTFYSLYPRIIVALAEQLQSNDKSVRILKFLIENRGELKQMFGNVANELLKIWLNYYYGVKCKDANTLVNHENVKSAARYLLERVISHLGRNLVYADTDEIYFNGSLNKQTLAFLDYVGFPYEVQEHKAGIFFGKKKFILIEGESTIRGFKNF
jgi:hypothetical protein